MLRPRKLPQLSAGGGIGGAGNAGGAGGDSGGGEHWKVSDETHLSPEMGYSHSWAFPLLLWEYHPAQPSIVRSSGQKIGGSRSRVLSRPANELQSRGESGGGGGDCDDAMGEALGDALGDSLGDALDVMLGLALGDALGDSKCEGLTGGGADGGLLMQHVPLPAPLKLSPGQLPDVPASL